MYWRGHCKIKMAFGELITAKNSQCVKLGGEYSDSVQTSSLYQSHGLFGEVSRWLPMTDIVNLHQFFVMINMINSYDGYMPMIMMMPMTTL